MSCMLACPGTNPMSNNLTNYNFHNFSCLVAVHTNSNLVIIIKLCIIFWEKFEIFSD